MNDYNATLAQETAVIRDKVKRGMLPLVARNPALDRATQAYALAQAEHYAGLRNPPIALRNNVLLDRCADLVLHEELTWSHPDKMSIVEFPVMSGRNEESYYNKHTLKSDLPFGDLRGLGATRTFERGEDDASEDIMPSYIPKRRLLPASDARIEYSEVNIDLHDALDNAGLTDRQREAVNLVYIENMTQAGAASVMRVSQPAVAKFERQALAKLREYMTKD